MNECVTHHQACQCREEKMQLLLHHMSEMAAAIFLLQKDFEEASKILGQLYGDRKEGQ